MKIRSMGEFAPLMMPFSLFPFVCLVRGGEDFVQNILYLGCYDGDQYGYAKEVPSAERCILLCTARSVPFVGLQIKNEKVICNCRVALLKRVKSSRCRECPFGATICGETATFALYTAVPTYLGCWRDDLKRTMTTLVIDVAQTNELCFRTCRNLSMPYAATQYRYECRCGSAYARLGRKTRSHCTLECRGRSTENCGGLFANSVYAIAHVPFVNMNVSDVYRCRLDLDGRCEGDCSSGWTGTMCERRDCSVNNGNCGNHKCEQMQLGGVSHSECVCSMGDTIDSIQHRCLDERLCAATSCGYKNTTFCVTDRDKIRCISKF